MKRIRTCGAVKLLSPRSSRSSRLFTVPCSQSKCDQKSEWTDIREEKKRENKPWFTASHLLLTHSPRLPFLFCSMCSIQFGCNCIPSEESAFKREKDWKCNFINWYFVQNKRNYWPDTRLSNWAARKKDGRREDTSSTHLGWRRKWWEVERKIERIDCMKRGERKRGKEKDEDSEGASRQSIDQPFVSCRIPFFFPLYFHYTTLLIVAAPASSCYKNKLTADRRWSWTLTSFLPFPLFPRPTNVHSSKSKRKSRFASPSNNEERKKERRNVWAKEAMERWRDLIFFWLSLTHTQIVIRSQLNSHTK